MSILRDVINIICMDGIAKGGSIILQRIKIKGIHSICLLLDIFQAFVRWSTYFIESRRSGRRLVCITLIEHMGDIVACEPVARYARAGEQNALIVWCAGKAYVDVIRQFRGIDGVIPLLCLTSWIVLRRWARFDRIIDLHLNGRTCLSCRIPLRKEEGDLRVTMENYYDHGSLLGSFCLSAGLPVLRDRPELSIPDEAVRGADRFALPNRTVVIHCSSNESCRDWLPAHWNHLIEALHECYGVTVVEIGIQSPLNRPDSSLYRNLCGQCSILESAELIRRALLFVGVDSGPAHVANAVGTFGVILLGDYLRFRNYTPYSGAYVDGSGAVLLRAHGEAATIKPAEVLEVIDNSRILVAAREGIPQGTTGLDLEMPISPDLTYE